MPHDYKTATSSSVGILLPEYLIFLLLIYKGNILWVHVRNMYEGVYLSFYHM
jgi:hypothetical protein